MIFCFISRGIDGKLLILRKSCIEDINPRVDTSKVKRETVFGIADGVAQLAIDLYLLILYCFDFSRLDS